MLLANCFRIVTTAALAARVPVPCTTAAQAVRTRWPCCSVVPKVDTLLAVAENYDVLLLDQFGVIHDGKTAYEGAVEAVCTMQKMGKKIVIISNSSRRRGDTVARLLSMGFGPVLGEDGELLQPEGCSTEGSVPISVVTSGDLVFEGLSAANAPPYDDLGVRAFVFGNGVRA